MADISIEVNEINVMSVERSAKGYLWLSELRQLKTANVLLKWMRLMSWVSKENDAFRANHLY